MAQTQHYDPRSHHRMSFASARKTFIDGSDTPRAYLEKCIEVIHTRDKDVKAFVSTHIPNARAAADASTGRYRKGRPERILRAGEDAEADRGHARSEHHRGDARPRCAGESAEAWHRAQRHHTRRIRRVDQEGSSAVSMRRSRRLN